MAEPNIKDIEAARAIMADFVDDEYLATKLGLEDAIATAITAARAEGEVAERKVWMQWADGLTGHKLYLASAMRRQIKTALEAAAGSKTKVFGREDEQKNLGR